MTDDVAGADAVALADVLEQRDQCLNLRLTVRIPQAPGRGVLEAGIDDFDADRARVEPGAALPLAFAGVPGPLVFIQQFVDGATRVVADQVVAADFAVGQQLQRAFQRSRGVMHDHELDAAVVIGRRVAGVVARTAGTTGENEQGGEKGKEFHGRRQYTEDDNATV